MLSHRIYGLALGYEDLNDHEQLRTNRQGGIDTGEELKRSKAPMEAADRSS
jgi:hypothetical protein